MRVEAVGHRVIVKPDPVETKTASGIVLQVNEDREYAAAQKGTVIAVGPMAWKNSLYGYGIEGWTPWVKEGDRVFFARYSGKQFRDEITQERFIIINDEDIQCKILDEKVAADNSDE